MIKQKGFQDYLNDDPSLTEKITYEEFERMQHTSINQKNDDIEDVYNDYLKFLKELENK